MASQLLIIVAFLGLPFIGFGQGKRVNGLKTGPWIEKLEDAYHNYTLQGNYKIIPLNQYDTIRSLGENCYEVKYKGSTPLIFYEERVNGNISTKDSIWKSFDAKGRLREIDFWIQGLNQWTKYFDEKGKLTEYDFDDYENDTSFYLTYSNGQLFKKAFFPPENKNRQTVVYYPENKLTISNAELAFVVDLLQKTYGTEKIVLNSKEDLIIESISTQRQFIRISSVTDQPLTYPLKITPDKPFAIKLTAVPSASNYQRTDTLLITTTESKIPYKIYSNIYAYHINGRTVETVQSIQLSKVVDKYLILPSMGTVTDATIISKTGEKRFYEIEGITKIDLSTFSIGTYNLLISSCNTGGQLKFTITE